MKMADRIARLRSMEVAAKEKLAAAKRGLRMPRAERERIEDELVAKRLAMMPPRELQRLSYDATVRRRQVLDQIGAEVERVCLSRGLAAVEEAKTALAEVQRELAAMRAAAMSLPDPAIEVPLEERPLYGTAGAVTVAELRRLNINLERQRAEAVALTVTDPSTLFAELQLAESRGEIERARVFESQLEFRLRARPGQDPAVDATAASLRARLTQHRATRLDPETGAALDAIAVDVNKAAEEVAWSVSSAKVATDVGRVSVATE